jgi:CAAX prenyl protease-like protein
MSYSGKKTVALTLPYVVWMAMMFFLPPTPECYAARTLSVLMLLIPCFIYLVRHQAIIHSNRRLGDTLLWGVVAGFAVAFIWVWPEQFEFYRRWFIIGEGGTDAVDESSMALKLVRLAGSAFVISVAEEMFFRRWLMKYAGFWWMVALFAVEHDRYLVGAAAGVIYGFVAMRKGLTAAIIAHVLTNLLLGLYVLQTGYWRFW